MQESNENEMPKLGRNANDVIGSTRQGEEHPRDEALLQEYKHFLSGKAEGTIDDYLRTIRHLMAWIADRPGNERHFLPQ